MNVIRNTCFRLQEVKMCNLRFQFMKSGFFCRTLLLNKYSGLWWAVLFKCRLLNNTFKMFVLCLKYHSIDCSEPVVGRVEPNGVTVKPE